MLGVHTAPQRAAMPCSCRCCPLGNNTPSTRHGAEQKKKTLFQRGKLIQVKHGKVAKSSASCFGRASAKGSNTSSQARIQRPLTRGVLPTLQEALSGLLAALACTNRFSPALTQFNFKHIYSRLISTNARLTAILYGCHAYHSHQGLKTTSLPDDGN